MKWYIYLKSNDLPEEERVVRNSKGGALLDYETYEENNLIVCHKLKFLNFGKFSSYLEFAKYMIKNTPVENRCFYETIFGDKTQRPYFDIEFYTSLTGEKPKDGEEGFYLRESEADESVEALVDCILEELKEQTRNENPLSVNKSHILVFTSHKSNKKSYHVVVEGFSVGNFKENKEFHDRIMKRMPLGWKDIVDHSMYKSLQQFRIAGNMKWQSNRVKVIDVKLTRSWNPKAPRGWIPKIKPDSDNHKLTLLLETSLITQTFSCIPLNCKPEEKKSYYEQKGKEESGEGFNPLTPDDIKEALKLCYKHFGYDFGDKRFPFNYLRTIEDNGTSSLILLKRLFASTCSVCNRRHEHENPFLIIAGENRDVFLDCRRNSENKKLYVGFLGNCKKSPKVISSDDSKITESEKEINHISLSSKIVIPKQPFDVKNFMSGSSKPSKINKLNFSLSDL
jgi:hypothetical protein